MKAKKREMALVRVASDSAVDFGRKRKAEGRRQKAVSKKQRAVGSRQ